MWEKNGTTRDTKVNYTKLIQTLDFLDGYEPVIENEKGFSLTRSAHDTKEEHSIDNTTETGL